MPSLYRPTTVSALALEWRVFEGRPAAFHTVSLLLHVLVSLLVTLLLASFLPRVAAAAGGALFGARIKGCVKERRRTFPLRVHQRLPG